MLCAVVSQRWREHSATTSTRIDVPLRLRDYEAVELRLKSSVAMTLGPFGSGFMARNDFRLAAERAEAAA